MVPICNSPYENPCGQPGGHNNPCNDDIRELERLEEGTVSPKLTLREADARVSLLERGQDVALIVQLRAGRGPRVLHWRASAARW